MAGKIDGVASQGRGLRVMLVSLMSSFPVLSAIPCLCLCDLSYPLFPS